MEAMLDSTRGFERNDPGWHCRVEVADTADDVLRLMRDYVASLAPDLLARLPDTCRALRVKAEDDVEYWTLRLSQRPRREHVDVDDDVRQEVFNHFLHASVRISRIHRMEAECQARGH